MYSVHCEYVRNFVGSNITNILSNCINSTTTIIFFFFKNSCLLNAPRGWCEVVAQEISTIVDQNSNFYTAHTTREKYMEMAESLFKFEEILMNKMMFKRDSHEWIKCKYLHCQSYQLWIQCAKGVFFSFQCNSFLCKSYMNCVFKCFHFFQFYQHIKSNWVSAIFPWTRNHKRWHL